MKISVRVKELIFCSSGDASCSSALSVSSPATLPFTAASRCSTSVKWIYRRVLPAAQENCVMLLIFYNWAQFQLLPSFALPLWHSLVSARLLWQSQTRTNAALCWTPPLQIIALYDRSTSWVLHWIVTYPAELQLLKISLCCITCTCNLFSCKNTICIFRTVLIIMISYRVNCTWIVLMRQ